MRTATLQGGRADEGRVGVPGPLRGQIPGPSREAGTQTDRAVRPGRGSDEEGSCGERIETLMKGNKVEHRGGIKKVMGRGWVIWFLQDERFYGVGGVCWGNQKKCIKNNAVEGPLRESASTTAVRGRDRTEESLVEGQQEDILELLSAPPASLTVHSARPGPREVN